MIGRRRALTLASGSLIASSLAGRMARSNPAGGGQGGGQDRGGSGPVEDDLLLDYLPLRLRQAQLVIASLFILFGSQLFMLRAAQGVDRRSEDRLGLGGLPLFGALMRSAFQASDFTPATRIGRAYAEGAAPFLFLYPQLALLPSVRNLILLNAAHSFALRDEYRPADWLMLAALMPTFTAIATVQRTVQARLAARQTAAASASATSISPSDMDSMVLGGLVSDARGDKTGVPVLGDIPLLDKLFVGDTYRREERQLVVLVRPSIIMGDSGY